MSEYLLNIEHERLSFFTPAGEVKALNDVSLHLSDEIGRASCRERV